jgi:ABC-type amino acid transport system permease subunit
MRIPFFSVWADVATFILRAVPLYVQLLIIYFVIPELIGINLPLLPAATLALSLCSAAYVSQIIRAGTNAIAQEQWEAAQMLAYSKIQTGYYIIAPQVIRNVMPSLIAELDQLLKSTSLASALGMLELTRAGMNIVSREMNPITIYLMVAFLYLCISAFLNGCGMLIEQRLSYDRN